MDVAIWTRVHKSTSSRRRTHKQSICSLVSSRKLEGCTRKDEDLCGSKANRHAVPSWRSILPTASTLHPDVSHVKEKPQAVAEELWVVHGSTTDLESRIHVRSTTRILDLPNFSCFLLKKDNGGAHKTTYRAAEGNEQGNPPTRTIKDTKQAINQEGRTGWSGNASSVERNDRRRREMGGSQRTAVALPWPWGQGLLRGKMCYEV